MSNVIKQHPVSGAIFASALVAKAIRNNPWFSHQLSEIELAKTLLQNSKMTDQKVIQLRSDMRTRGIKIAVVNNLSKSLVPATIFAIAFQCDAWFRKN